MLSLNKTMVRSGQKASQTNTKYRGIQVNQGMLREYYRMSNNIQRISKHIHRISRRNPEYHRILGERQNIPRKDGIFTEYQTKPTG
jgi:hypothetical protein